MWSRLVSTRKARDDDSSDTSSDVDVSLEVDAGPAPPRKSDNDDPAATKRAADAEADELYDNDTRTIGWCVAGLTLTTLCQLVAKFTPYAYYGYALTTNDVCILVVLLVMWAWAMVAILIDVAEQSSAVARVVDHHVTFFVAIAFPAVIFVFVGVAAANHTDLTPEQIGILAVTAVLADVVHFKLAYDELEVAPSPVAFWLSFVGTFSFLAGAAGAYWVASYDTAFYWSFAFGCVLAVALTVFFFWLGYCTPCCVRVRVVLGRDGRPRERRSAGIRVRVVLLAIALLVSFALITWYGTFHYSGVLVTLEGVLGVLYGLLALWALYRCTWRCSVFMLGGTERANARGSSVLRAARATESYLLSPPALVLYTAVCVALALAAALAPTQTDATLETVVGALLLAFAFVLVLASFVTWKAPGTRYAPLELAVVCTALAMFFWVQGAFPSFVNIPEWVLALLVVYPVAATALLVGAVVLYGDASTPSSRATRAIAHGLVVATTTSLASVSVWFDWRAPEGATLVRCGEILAAVAFSVLSIVYVSRFAGEIVLGGRTLRSKHVARNGALLCFFVLFVVALLQLVLLLIVSIQSTRGITTF